MTLENFSLGQLSEGDASVELAERKGKGHPDTMADALSEAFSRALSNHYLEQCGSILHHNVDKLLIAAGRSKPAFGGGEIILPFDVYLAGRATVSVNDMDVPIEDIARQTVSDWLTANFHALDPVRSANVYCLVRPGASELVELFGRQRMPLANDTSIGAAFAPLSPTEKLVLATERYLTSETSITQHPERGEDVKVMAMRNGSEVRLTIACAMIGKYLDTLDDYAEAKRMLASDVLALPEAGAAGDVGINVNAADDLARGSVYLTVTGTSAEAGDDGQTGRGNRVNGLITPLKPTSMEAIAGKNPVNHVGKLYNVVAQRICNSIIEELPEVTRVHCALLSEIGQPIDQPARILIRIMPIDGFSLEKLRGPVARIVNRHMQQISSLTLEFAAGTVSIY